MAYNSKSVVPNHSLHLHSVCERVEYKKSCKDWHGQHVRTEENRILYMLLYFYVATVDRPLSGQLWKFRKGFCNNIVLKRTPVEGYVYVLHTLTAFQVHVLPALGRRVSMPRQTVAVLQIQFWSYSLTTSRLESLLFPASIPIIQLQACQKDGNIKYTVISMAVMGK